MKTRLVTHGENCRIELVAVGFEAVDVACRQACAMGDKGRAKLFVEKDFSKKSRHEIRHGKGDALFG